MSDGSISILKAINRAYDFLKPWSDTHEHEKRHNTGILSLIKEHFPDKGAKIIDVGCGIGILLVALRELGYGNIAGIEKHVFRDEDTHMFKVENPDGLKGLWDKLNIQVLDMDLFDIQKRIQKEKYDIAINSAVIEHLKDPRRFLGNINFILRKGGSVVTMSPNFAVFYKRLRFLFGLPPSWDIKDFFELGEKGFVGHWREYTVDELKKMHEWAGFEITRALNMDIFELHRKKTLRNIFHIVLRYASFFIPNSREANIVIARKI